MNIAVISTFDTWGGAPIATCRLHKGLRSLRQDTLMMVKTKISTDPYVYHVVVKNSGSKRGRDAFSLMEKKLITENRTGLSNTYFSLPYPGFDLSKTAFIHCAAIINLHWVENFNRWEVYLPC